MALVSALPIGVAEFMSGGSFFGLPFPCLRHYPNANSLSGSGWAPEGAK